jgi:hypothetical protein
LSFFIFAFLRGRLYVATSQAASQPSPPPGRYFFISRADDFDEAATRRDAAGGSAGFPRHELALFLFAMPVRSCDYAGHFTIALRLMAGFAPFQDASFADAAIDSCRNIFKISV